ncbi:30S ribosomal protein S8e [Candidatus Woesearchaeota archaeon]|nr:30S ribosomal protein S8e [Candidatus Woesearchaeota archaeon]
MVVIQSRSKRKITGGRYKKVLHKKRQSRKGNSATLTGIDDKIIKETRTRGGNKKIKSLTNNKVNIYDPKKKKHFSAEIKEVIENPADSHFVKRNIITKGAIIKTDKGNARVTNRPGQEGAINAVLKE